jgi:hypothetical protein
VIEEALYPPVSLLTKVPLSKLAIWAVGRYFLHSRLKSYR